MKQKSACRTLRRVEELAAACVPEEELLAAVRVLVPEYVEPRHGE